MNYSYLIICIYSPMTGITEIPWAALQISSHKQIPLNLDLTSRKITFQCDLG